MKKAPPAGSGALKKRKFKLARSQEFQLQQI
jgi:hypothetical protein